MAITLTLAPEERQISRTLFLLTDKPTIFAANVKETELASADANPHVQKVGDYARSHHACETVVISAQLESDLVDLTPEEAASMGRLANAASSALRRTEGAEHIYAAVIGHGVEHLHLHLIPRYPGTPREFWWTRVDEWPDAPRGDAADVIALAQRLRLALTDLPSRHRPSGRGPR